MPRRKPDTKVEELRARGCLHPHPQRVTDDIFLSSEFFDPRDLLQVKYEMLRRVRVDGRPVHQSAAACGLSRPSYYQAERLFEEGGLSALLPKKTGPRRAHKLSEEVMGALTDALEKQPHLNSSDLACLIKERFSVTVHPRSIERALARQEKKRQT